MSTKEIVETLKKADNEGTAEPWWVMFDLGHLHDMFVGTAEHGEIPSMDRILTAVAMNMAGPFFSRGDAENYLKSRRYDYTEHAKVWCSSGYRSQKYKDFYRSEVGLR